jgi:MFS family permease
MSGETVAGETIASTIDRAAVMRRVTWRLLPFLMLCYLTSVVDRVNVGFAALQMNKDLGLSASIFGLGGGIFYISFCLLAIPSNLALARFGARIWIARLMITWGVISGCMALVTGPNSFVALRFLLGAAEAGFFPGIILYLTYWFPRRERARIVAIFMIAVPMANFLGSPISGALLGIEHFMGLRGWQWMFIVEAVPTVLLGFACLIWLSDRPGTAVWLDELQRRQLEASLAQDEADDRTPKPSVWQILRNPGIILLGLVYAGSNTASTGLTLWQPQLIKAFGLTNTETGLLNALPFLAGACLMVWWSRRSDRMGERVWHAAIPLAMIGCGLFGCLVVKQLAPTILMLCVAIIGTYAVKGPFWAFATEWLSSRSAAPGIAYVNAIANLMSFVAPFLVGIIKDKTGNYPLALMPIVGFALLAVVIVLGMGWAKRRVARASMA